MNSEINKPFIIFLSILCSIIFPIVILLLFFVTFSDFYDRGFLPGLGHIFMCGIMILLNLIIGIPLILKFIQNSSDNISIKIISIIFVSESIS